MPGISRVIVDSAGAPIIGILAPTVTVNGSPIVVKGASVTPHSDGLHLSGPVMVGSSLTVTANNIPVCRQGDNASCGHLASGSVDVTAG